MGSTAQRNAKSWDSATPIAGRRPAFDHFDALLRQLRTAHNGTPAPQIIGITGCARGSGASTVAINLALSGVSVGSGPVLLVDADLGHATLGRALRIEPGPGWAEMLAGSESPLKFVQHTRIERLSLLRSGQSGALDFYSPERLAECFRTWRSEYGLIVIDLPPTEEVNPHGDLAGKLDGVVLIIEAEKTSSEAAQRAKRQLLNSQARLLGVVLNKRRAYLPSWLHRST